MVYGASERGETLCCDATLVSPLHRNGHATSRAAHQDGAALARARGRKRRVYPELGRGGTRLVVLGSEVGGRWDAEAVRFVRTLARCRTQRAPPLMRGGLAGALAHRWWCLLSVAVQKAVAASCLGFPLGPFDGLAAAEGPPVADTFSVFGSAMGPSRLPLRS